MNENPTPESKLWTLVLATFAEDAGSIFRLSKRGSEWDAHVKSRTGALRYELHSEWCSDMCEMIDVDHEFFIDAIEKILAGKEMRRNKHTGGTNGRPRQFNDEGHDSLPDSIGAEISDWDSEW